MVTRLLSSRLLSQHFKTLTLTLNLTQAPFRFQPPSFPLLIPTPHSSIRSLLRPFSSGANGGGDDGSWNFPSEPDNASIFGEEEAGIAGIAEESKDPWAEEPKGDVFGDIDKESLPKVGGEDEWGAAMEHEPWDLGGGSDERDIKDVFGEIGEEGIEGVEGIGGGEGEGEWKSDELLELEKKEQDLLATLKGPNRAFGDLIAASGITEDMLDSLILLKDVRGIPGLPPLHELEDKAVERMSATSSRTEIERKKQEEVARARVRQVDEKGRAYGTGRRKCSIARVWIQPGDGQFIVNEKQFDAYFPILDHRAELLGPFTVTKTLGRWDVKCTVKGGGVSGQVGAVRLGISRALQNWEPGLRPYLKSVGYLRRDPRVVERKKPGKPKARKSFQWVKR